MRQRLARLLGDRMIRRFFGAAGVALGLRVAWAVLNYAGVVLLARWLSGPDYGRYAFIMSTVSFLGVACGLGTSTAVMRFIAQYQSESRPGLARGAVLYASRSVLAVSSAVALLGILGTAAAGALGLADRPLVYALGFLILPSFALIEAQSAAARAYGALVSALSAREIAWRASLILIGYAVTWLAEPIQLLVLIGGAAITMACAALFQRYRLYVAMPLETRAAPPEWDARAWRKVAAPIWIAGVAITALTTLDVVTLGFFLPKEQVGWYFVASRTAALAGFVLLSLNLFVGPEVGRLYYAGEIENLRRLLRISAVAIFTPSFGVFLVCALFGRQILGVFGPEFVAARLELAILAAGQAVMAGGGCVGVLMNMTGHHAKAAEVQLTTAIAATLGIVAGGVAFGLTGAAVASALGIAALTIRMCLYVRRNMGLDPSILGFIGHRGN